MAYCGDETGAFIGDCGFSSCRFGYGGEDCPKHVTPSYISSDFSHIPSLLQPPPTNDTNNNPSDIIPLYTHPTPSQTTPSPTTYLHTPTSLLSSPPAFHATWEHALTTLRARDRHKHNLPPPSSPLDHSLPHPLCLISTHHVSTPGTRAQNRSHLEFVFETLGAPAAFLAASPMVQAFSMGRQTGVVVDMSGSGCCVTPVVDGLILRGGQRRNGRGGAWLEDVQRGMVGEVLKKGSKGEITARYELKRREGTRRTVTKGSFFHDMAVREVMYEMKTGWHVGVTPFGCGVVEGGGGSVDGVGGGGEDDDDDEGDVEKKVFELPDGTKIDLTEGMGAKLCRLPDLLFTENPLDSLNLPPSPSPPPPPSSSFPQTLSHLPLSRLIHSSITSVDPDLRKELCGNILLCGSHSLFPNLESRLSAELSESLVPSSYKVKVVAPKFSVERRYAGWIGGSVLTSLGNFQQLWLSRGEYEEYGATLGCERFP